MTYDFSVPPRRASGEAWVSHGAEPRAVEAIESALQTLLQRHPDGVVFAISGGGVPKPMPVPGTIPLVRHESASGAAQLMDEVIPADRALVAKLWGQARTQGAAVAVVRRVSDPENPSNLYLLDVRHRHQVMIGLFTRISAFILAGEMAFAYFLGHMFKNPAEPVFLPLLNNGSLAILLCFACLYLATSGGGPISVDGMRQKS